MTVSVFTETLRAHPNGGQDEAFLPALFRGILAECGRVTPAGVAGLEPFGQLLTPTQQSLLIVREALTQVSAENRAILLLRDQCHLPFRHIAYVIGISDREIRSACLAAREQLRSKVKDSLEALKKKNDL